MNAKAVLPRPWRFAAGSCKSLSHELAQGTTPRRARLPSRQSEGGAAAGGARSDRAKGRGRVHLCRCRADGRRQPGGAVSALSRPRRTSFQHCAARLKLPMSAEDLLEAEVLIYLRGLGFPTDRRPADAKNPAEPPPVPPSDAPSGPWGKPK